MIYLQRVATEIKTVGLYDLILQDVQKLAGKNRVSDDDILEIMSTHPQILEDYKQTNVEYNLSNIHVKNIPLENLQEPCRQKAQQVNANLDLLRDIEKYTLDFEQSSTLVIIFSVEFFVLFSVQYFIVLLDLKEWQWWIYGVFALSIVVAWQYAKKEKKKFEANSKIFDEKYMQTLKLIEELEAERCISKSELIITECDEHV
ncbi:MAG: hypothetical protein DSZ03_08500 [Sulfurimonas sp.]|nr:MAG: hypothetical protein DSZ03_08500 [Sulfurimonas sp.]